MIIKKMDLRDGGCEMCKRVKYNFKNQGVEPIYPFDHVYVIEIGLSVHRICKDCLKDLGDAIDVALKKEDN